MAFYACVIVNPASANGATGRRWPELRAALDKVLDRWDNQFTLGPGDATRLAREAAREGYEMIVCVGGDGTMSEVVTGLFEEDEAGISDQLVRKDLVLAAVRQGTGGDFARYLGLPTRLPASVAHLSGPQVRACDLGVAEYQDHEGALRRSAFLNISSFGLSGLVDEKVNTSTKALGGTASFMIGLGRALVSYRPQAVRIEVDGEVFHDGPIVTCAVANGQYFGGGMRFAPQAQIDDGKFDVVVQTKTGLKEVLSLPDLYSGRLQEWSSVRTTQGQEVTVVPSGAQDRVLLDIDGEQPGRAPATFKLISKGVRVKIP